MPIRIKAPDGTFAEFPDGTDDATIQSVMAKEYGGPAAPKPKVKLGTDVAKSTGSGLIGGVAGTADFLGGGPGSPSSLIDAAGSVASVFGAKNAATALHGTAQALANPITKVADKTIPLATYQPQTTAGKYAKTIATMAPNAALPGGLIPRAAAVLVPGLISEGAGQGAEALGAGPKTAAAARVVGGMAGGLATGVRIGPRAAADVESSALTKLNRQTPQNAGVIQSNASELGSHGIIPTLTDVVDEAGKGVIAASARRGTAGRQVASDYAEGTRNALPGRMSAQARKHLSDDPRTPAEIGEDLAGKRGAAADKAFGAVRNETFEMPAETSGALRTDHGRAAIREAASRERDPEVRAMLNRLADAALDEPNTAITVGMADRVSRVLFGRARAAVQSGDSDLAATLTQLGNSVRNPAMAAHPGYRSAVTGFSQQSKLIDAAERGEDYMSRDTDAFRADLAAIGPDGLPLARATARRAVERASGENVGAAPGVARRLATAPEQQARTRALLDEPEAQEFERAMQLEAKRVTDANTIDPKSGSATAVRAEDTLKTAGEVTGVIAQAGAGHHVGAALSAAKLWLKGQGLTNAEAEALVRIATDPAKTNMAILRLTNRIGPDRAQAFMRVLTKTAGPALLTTAAAPAPEPQQEQ